MRKFGKLFNQILFSNLFIYINVTTVYYIEILFFCKSVKLCD